MGGFIIWKFFFRRLLISFFAIFGLLFLTFILIHIYPGGPFDEDIKLAPEVLEALKRQYGLNLSLLGQLSLYLKNIFFFNFGPSILYPGKTIAAVIALAWPRSLIIGSLTLIISIVCGSLLGILYFLSQSKNLVRVLHYSFLSAPSLFLGPAFILIFGIWFNWLPITINDSALSYVLPIAVMSVRPIANIARLLMSGLEESLTQPWVTTTQAFGFNRHTIIRYGLKQSMIPVFSYLGQATAGILSGSILIEIMFNVQGMGTLFVESLINRDYGLITTLTLLYGGLLIFAGFVFDSLSYFLDPRVEKL